MSKKKNSKTEISPEEQSFEELKTKNFFKICNSEDELRAWFNVYFGIHFPSETSDPESTSNPIHAAYTIYSAVRDNTGDVNPGFIMLSARAAYKTLIASALETVLMFHFRITIAHMAAIRDQSDKAVSYVTDFVTKTQKYWKAHGWEKVSDNKKKTEFLTPNNERPYLTVVIATMAGANCITGDTIISTDKGDISASDVFFRMEQGESFGFFSLDHKSNKIELQNVTNCFTSIKPLVEIHLEDGTVVNCSPEHKFYVEDVGYVEAKDLAEGVELNVKR